MIIIKPQARIRQADVYQHYLASVQQAAGASGASLLIEPAEAQLNEPFLIHIGTGDTIPEMIDVDTAVSSVVNLAVTEASINFVQSEAPTACLLRLSIGSHSWPEDSLSSAEMDNQERRENSPEESDSEFTPRLWIGLRFDDPDALEELRNLAKIGVGTPQDRPSWLAHTFTMGANLVWETHKLRCLLRDPVSQLPARAEFQARLKTAFQKAEDNAAPLGLLLINPDEFGAINHRLDQESGDKAVAEIAQSLSNNLRNSDTVYRYGGAVFAMLMPQANEQSVDAVAKKLHEALTGAYLEGAVRLTFSVGAVIFNRVSEEDSTLDELGLLRRADHALNLAKRAGGDCSVIWSPDETQLPGVGVDRLSGIFTADAEKDYRNMLLMWDTIAVLSASAQKEQIASEFVARINLSLKPNRVALIEYSADTKSRQLAVAQRSDTNGSSTMAFTSAQSDLLQQASDLHSTEQLSFHRSESDGGEQIAFRGYAVPILVDERSLGCLYLDGPEHSHVLDASDLIFLEALTAQLGLALDRADLAARRREETERESRLLREEVSELRQAVHSARLVYASKQMETVLDTLRAVAPTDVTILINGESGTGKEMLARSLHELSDRNDKPLVTVDCGAIAYNLIEAELFGYVKGAYTGAHKSSEGRIVQAAGGTLFLDEIGEIPLDVQAKLLRFVQEKEINPVGAVKSRHVDTRIVAATNRDLGKEVAAGKFREDLYYRLKVVTVTSPPLRDRIDDILPLAKHFLDKFALQYQKRARRFSSDAKDHLQKSQWPGNVRELQNCILRAVVLSERETIDSDMLHTETEGTVPAAVATEAQPLPPVSDAIASPDRAPVATTDDPWSDLEHSLVEQVALVLADRSVAPVPLGRWLIEDLVLTANDLADGNSRQASADLQVAETTYRRQLEKAQRTAAQGLLSRTRQWEKMPPILAHLMRSVKMRRDKNNVLDRAKSLLLTDVLARVGRDDALGAALMGVTVITYRRWAEKSLYSPVDPLEIA